MMLDARSRRLSILSFALILAAALAIAGCGDSDDSDSASNRAEWRIGLQGPLSGDLAGLGKGMLQGAELAADEINDAGGVLGKEIEIVPIDDKGEPMEGVASAKAAIADGLDAVVGPYNSGVGLESLPLFIEAGLVPLRLTSDNKTNGKGFTLQPMTYQIAPVAATAVAKWLKAKSVAIVYDVTEAYTKGQANNVSVQLQKQGVKVDTNVPIEPGKQSYKDAIAYANRTKPDAIYLVTYFPEGGLIAKEMRAEKIAAKCLADYGAYDAGFIKAAGETAAEDCPVVGVPAPSNFASSAGHVSDFVDEFDTEPGTWSPYTYDSVKLLAEGADKAGGFEPAKLNPVLGAIKGWKGWTGSVTIDPSNGNRDPATVVVTTPDGKGGFTVDTSWAKAVGAPYAK